MPHGRYDLEGKRFGRLVVKEYSHSNKKNRQINWLCQCDCGKTKVVSSNALKRKKYPTESCGCLTEEKRIEVNIESTVNSLIYRYKKGAEERGLSYELSEQEFRWLIENNCHFCGIEPHRTLTNPEGEFPHLKYNGIDRLNSDKGYSYGNCVTACKNCNFAKRDLTVAEFFEWIQRLSNNLRKLDEID